MAKYTELQTRKLISSYGGVGSIIETTEGALIIKEFDYWHYFKLISKRKIEAEENEIINDERLLKRLKFNFPKLKTLIKVPPNYSAIFNTSLPKSADHIVNAEYFPKWMYCSKCGSFMHLNDWYKGWKNVFNSTDINKINNSFIPPCCYKCYDKAVKTKEHKKYSKLEQVRFILTAPNGEIRDIPWELWTNLTRPDKNDKEQDEESLKSSIIFNGKCCEKQDLEYIRDGKMSDLSGVRIRCNNPICPTNGIQKSFSGLFGLRLYCEYVKGTDGNIKYDNNGKELKFCFKPVIRTSNSVYYPLITNSLYLPQVDVISIKSKETAYNLYHENNMPIEEISKILKVSLYDLNDFLIPTPFIKETDYRLKEYKYLTSEASPNNNNLSYEVEKSIELKNFGIAKILRINRLKLTSIQTGYSRQDPIDKDLFELFSMDEFIPASRQSVKAKYTSTKRSQTEILPGIESFGEGIFIDFDWKEIAEWSEKQYKNENFKNRIETLMKNAKTAEYRLSEEKQKMIKNPYYLAKFLVLHTFSHILIKELEFLVGYPATSLSERLYINETGMQGILIYTIAGAEGSFGGLISQSKSDRFIKIVKSAISRANDCSSDPICYNSEGQGIGGLNLAACYSCTLLPETSCEEFNSYLDRAILVDQEYGWFFTNH